MSASSSLLFPAMEETFTDTMDMASPYAGHVDDFEIDGKVLVTAGELQEIGVDGEVGVGEVELDLTSDLASVVGFLEVIVIGFVATLDLPVRIASATAIVVSPSASASPAARIIELAVPLAIGVFVAAVMLAAVVIAELCEFVFGFLLR